MVSPGRRPELILHYPMSDQNILVGYARKQSNAGKIKISINAEAIKNCDTYMTSDGQTYVPLQISLHALQKVIAGERAVTTVIQERDE